MCNKVLVSWYRCKRHSSWGRGGERWAMVGRAILISFPSSPSLMKYIAPISFSAFLSIRAQKLFTKTVWPSVWDKTRGWGRKALASLPLPSVLEAEGRVWSSAQPPTTARYLPPWVQVLLAHLCCQIPTLQKPLEEKQRSLTVSFCLCEMQLLLLLSLACSMEPAGVWIRPFRSKTGGMLMFKIK